MDVDEDATEPPVPIINGATVPVPATPTTAPPAPLLVASIMGTAVVDDVPSQSPSPSPSPPPEDAPDVDIPEPEDVEAEDPEVEDEAADVETSRFTTRTSRQSPGHACDHRTQVCPFA